MCVNVYVYLEIFMHAVHERRCGIVCMRLFDFSMVKFWNAWEDLGWAEESACNEHTSLPTNRGKLSPLCTPKIF